MGENEKQFWIYFTNLMPYIILQLGAFVHFLFGSKYKFMYYLTAVCFDLHVAVITKLIYAAPRPYMIDKDIQALDCATEYGKPSGHSSASSTVFIVLVLDIFHGAKFPD